MVFCKIPTIYNYVYMSDLKMKCNEATINNQIIKYLLKN